MNQYSTWVEITKKEGDVPYHCFLESKISCEDREQSAQGEENNMHGALHFSVQRE